MHQIYLIYHPKFKLTLYFIDFPLNKADVPKAQPKPLRERAARISPPQNLSLRFKYSAKEMEETKNMV